MLVRGSQTDVMPENEVETGDHVLSLDSDVEQLGRLGPFLDGFCAVEGIPERTCSQLQVAFEELTINAIRYGKCEPKNSAIRLAIWRKGDEISAVFSDSGVAFNPLEAPPPDTTGSILNRPLGGLGIHLVRHLMSSIRYERRDGRNFLYLSRPVKPGTFSPEEGTRNRELRDRRCQREL